MFKILISVLNWHINQCLKYPIQFLIYIVSRQQGHGCLYIKMPCYQYRRSYFKRHDFYIKTMPRLLSQNSVMGQYVALSLCAHIGQICHCLQNIKAKSCYYSRLTIMIPTSGAVNTWGNWITMNCSSVLTELVVLQQKWTILCDIYIYMLLSH